MPCILRESVCGASAEQCRVCCWRIGCLLRRMHLLRLLLPACARAAAHFRFNCWWMGLREVEGGTACVGMPAALLALVAGWEPGAEGGLLHMSGGGLASAGQSRPAVCRLPMGLCSHPATTARARQEAYHTDAGCASLGPPAPPPHLLPNAVKSKCRLHSGRLLAPGGEDGQSGVGRR